MFSFLAWATMLLETVGRGASGKNGRDRGERTQDAGGSLGSFGRDHWPMWALWRGHGAQSSVRWPPDNIGQGGQGGDTVMTRMKLQPVQQS